MVQQLPVQGLTALCRADPRTVLLDVREPWEVALAPLAVDGATLLAIPMQQLPARVHELPRGHPVVCICHHGARSQQVAAWLERGGVDRVYNLAGGVDAWSREIDPAVPRY